jgi:hypothetical protein
MDVSPLPQSRRYSIGTSSAFGALPSPETSPSSLSNDSPSHYPIKHQTALHPEQNSLPDDYWREAVLYWNQSDYRWCLIEYIPGLLAITWSEDRVGPIERLTAFPAEAELCFVKRAEADRLAAIYSQNASVATSLCSTYQSIFRGPARHQRRISHPEIPEGPRLTDPEGITQTSWLFGRFLQQVLKATKISCTALILALKFSHTFKHVWRANTAAGRVQLNSVLVPREGEFTDVSQYRVFVTSLLLADKYTEDHSYTNKAWSTLSGLPINDINAMEREFLSLLGHALYVSEEEFREWVKILQSLCHWHIPHPQKLAQELHTLRFRRLSVSHVPGERASREASVPAQASQTRPEPNNAESSFWSRLKLSSRR